ncbi:hypothetical protein Slin15195_G130420 [Septoria linicola]|uniref:Uncharacterized protein n=1 Tax=Septoria linicola TaxID=215465 RepID=A0A9Q9B673_9PEZI|nr:hypothetical protein Slin15195_G130420 [Septoria linicola]
MSPSITTKSSPETIQSISTGALERQLSQLAGLYKERKHIIHLIQDHEAATLSSPGTSEVRQAIVLLGQALEAICAESARVLEILQDRYDQEDADGPG